VNALLITQING